MLEIVPRVAHSSIIPAAQEPGVGQSWRRPSCSDRGFNGQLSILGLVSTGGGHRLRRT